MDNSERLFRDVRPYKLFEQFLPVSENTQRKLNRDHHKVRYPTQESDVPFPYKALLSKSVQIKQIKNLKWVSLVQKPDGPKEYKLKSHWKKRKTELKRKQIVCFSPQQKQKWNPAVTPEKISLIRTKSEQRKIHMIKIKKITDSLSNNSVNYHHYSNHNIPYSSQKSSISKNPKRKIQLSASIQVQEQFPSKSQSILHNYEKSLKRVKLKPIPKWHKEQPEKMKTINKINEPMMRNSIRGWTKYPVNPQIKEDNLQL